MNELYNSKFHVICYLVLAVLLSVNSYQIWTILHNTQKPLRIPTKQLTGFSRILFLVIHQEKLTDLKLQIPKC